MQIAKQAKSEIILIHACELIESVFKDTQALYKEHNKMISDKAMENLLFSKAVAMHEHYKEGVDKIPKNAF